jgi:hypothetical protein
MTTDTASSACGFVEKVADAGHDVRVAPVELHDMVAV